MMPSEIKERHFPDNSSVETEATANSKTKMLMY